MKVIKNKTRNLIIKKLDKYFKSSILIKYFNSLDFKKYFSRNIFKNLVKKSRSLSSGVMSPKTLRSKLMKAKKDIFQHTMWMWFSAALLIALLTACGGGGGGGVTPPGGSGTDTVIITPTPTMTITYTAIAMCASGPNLTSTVSQLAANVLVPSACPALPVSTLAATFVVVGSGTLNISVTGLPAGFTGGTLSATKVTPSTTSNWDLIPTTTGNASATLRAGSPTVSFATVYNGSIMMNFAGAPSASKTVTFTTGADPSVAVTWPANITNLVEVGIVNGTVNQNLKVTVWTPLSPVASNIGNNANWNANLTNGNVKIVKSGEMANDTNNVMQNVWTAMYKDASGNSCIRRVYASTGEAYGNTSTTGRCFTDSLTYAIGVTDSDPRKNGVIYRYRDACVLNTITRGDESVTCPF